MPNHGFGKNRAEQRATVTYMREDGQMFVTREGRGSTLTEAVADADRQLRPGRWQRRAISAPQTIAVDLDALGQPLRARASSQGRRRLLGEGETIEVTVKVRRS